MGAIRKIGVTLAATTLIGGCTSKSNPAQSPDFSRSATAPPSTSALPSASTEPPPVMPWPAVAPCTEAGVYSLPDEPTQYINCAVGYQLKQRIDAREKVDFFTGTVRLGNVGLNGICTLGPFYIETTINDIRNLFLGIAKVEPDGGAGVFVAAFQPTSAIPEEGVRSAVVEPGPEGIYTVDYNGQTTIMGTIVDAQVCQA